MGITGDRAAEPIKDLHRIGNLERELSTGAEWLRQQLALAGRHRVVIGLSGGIDSAVVALWAARALGVEAAGVTERLLC